MRIDAEKAFDKSHDKFICDKNCKLKKRVSTKLNKDNLQNPKANITSEKVNVFFNKEEDKDVCLIIPVQHCTENPS